MFSLFFIIQSEINIFSFFISRSKINSFYSFSNCFQTVYFYFSNRNFHSLKSCAFDSIELIISLCFFMLSKMDF